MFRKAADNLGDLSTMNWLIAVIPVICLVLYRYISHTFHFAKNLLLKVYILSTTGKNGMQEVSELLEKSKMYSIHNKILNLESNKNILQTIKKRGIYIVGYSDKFNGYKKLVEKIKDDNSALIVFAHSVNIVKKDKDIFDGYIYCDIVNSHARLMTTVNNLMMTMR